MTIPGVADLHVGIDARAASHPQSGGFKTHVTGLLHGLAKADPAGRYTVYLDRFTPHLGASASEQMRWVIMSQRAPIVGMVLREQLLLPRQARRDGIDVLHSPAGT